MDPLPYPLAANTDRLSTPLPLCVPTGWPVGFVVVSFFLSNVRPLQEPGQVIGLSLAGQKPGGQVECAYGTGHLSVMRVFDGQRVLTSSNNLGA